MKRKHATILMGVAGVFIFLTVVVIAGGAWFFASAFESTPADAQAADASFATVRERFAGVTPAFELTTGEDLVVRREPPAGGPARPIERIHLRHWDPDENGLTEVTLPFWLVRMNPGEFSVTADQHGLREVTAEQIARYGPTLLVDYADGSGDRLLIWTD